MIIVGELINCTRKKVAPAVERRDVSFIQDLARRQAEAGAHYVDVNSGIPGAEVETMTWLVETVQEAVSVPLSLDTADAKAMRAGLEHYRGPEPPLLNSITLEEASLRDKLPLVKEFPCRAIGLLMSDTGVPTSAQDRVNRASSIVEKLTEAGLSPESIFIDPCILPVSADISHGRDVLDSIEAIKTNNPGVRIIVGLSNVSYGLPARKLLNQVYLLLAMAKGLDAAILDPLDRRMMAHIVSAETLLGRDDWCANYIQAHREGKLELEGL